LGIIATDIKTEEQLNIIAQMKCDMAQGYFFSKPIDQEALNNYLSEKQKEPYLS